MEINELIYELETVHPFIEWLESLEPNTQVGDPSQSDQCPVINFILDITDDPYNNYGWVLGTYNLYHSKEYSSRIVMSTWYNNFINYCFENFPNAMNLTAQDCLNSLTTLGYRKNNG